MEKCLKIIEQVNQYSTDQYLLTTSIGEETGVRGRSRFFCFDHLWAWWNGVSYDKNEVAHSIAQSFKKFDFNSLNKSKKELETFCKNLEGLRDKFQKSPSFTNKQLDETISNLKDKVLPLRLPEPRYRELPEGEVAIRIQTLDVASFTQELNLLEEGSYRGDLKEDKEKILNLITLNSEETVRQTSTEGSDFKVFKRLFEGIDHARQEIASNPSAWRGPDIIGKPQTILSYVTESFGRSKNSRKEKSMERAMHFAEKGYLMQIARGDGNCFTSSLAAGLMDIVKKNPDYRKTLIEKLSSFQRCEDRYVSLDMKPSAPPYSQSFTKKADFAKVLEALEQGKEDLDNQIMAAFSRILRYILTLEQFENVYIEGATSRVGEELGFANIFTFNKVFELDARVLVLEAESFIGEGGVEHLNEQDPADSSLIFRASGTQDGQRVDDPKTKMGPVKITDLLEESPDASFSVIRTDGHFNLMVRE